MKTRTNLFNRLQRNFLRCLTSGVFILGGIGGVSAQPLLDPVELLSDFVGVDTVNPPGNEANAVAFYARYLDELGIAYETGESAPGRGNLWARLKGGAAPGLMLLQHTDVVPGDPRYWLSDPLQAEIREGYLYGRGVVDMKGTGIAQFLAFVAIAQSGVVLNRDLVFMASADEEAGGFFGVDWVIKNHPEAFEGIGYLLNEGGSGLLNEGEKVFAIEVTQKVPVWLKISAEGEPGHGSYPRPESSVTKLLKALNQLQSAPFPIRVIPPVDRYFKGLAAGLSGQQAIDYQDIAAAVQRPDFVRALHRSHPALHALLRDTCSITMLAGSSKINVVPPIADAEADCRMLPDRAASAFVEDFKARVAGAGLTVDLTMAFSPAISDASSSLIESIQETLSALHPGARFTFSVASGFTDSHFTRDLGIQSYGFSPMLYLDGEARGVHGNNEAVHVERYRRAVSDYQAVIEAFVLRPAQ